jgi:hypothetical protein
MSDITQLLKTIAMFSKTVHERVNAGVPVTAEDLKIIEATRQHLDSCVVSVRAATCPAPVKALLPKKITAITGTARARVAGHKPDWAMAGSRISINTNVMVSPPLSGAYSPAKKGLSMNARVTFNPHTPGLTLVCGGCAGLSFDKPSKSFRPCKKRVCSSSGMCSHHRTQFIECGGNLLHGYNEIRGGKCNYLNKKEWQWYPGWDTAPHGEISNPIIKRFLHTGNRFAIDDYPKQVVPTKTEKSHFFTPLNEIEFITAEHELPE